MVKIDKNMMIIGGVVVVGIIAYLWFQNSPIVHKWLHAGDKPRSFLDGSEITQEMIDARKAAMYAGYY